MVYPFSFDRFLTSFIHLYHSILDGVWLKCEYFIEQKKVKKRSKIKYRDCDNGVLIFYTLTNGISICFYRHPSLYYKNNIIFYLFIYAMKEKTDEQKKKKHKNLRIRNFDLNTISLVIC